MAQDHLFALAKGYELAGYRFGEVARAVRANPGVSAGFGGAVYLLLWVPLLNTLFIPAATVGATLLFHELRATGRIAPSAYEGAGRSLDGSL